MASDIQVLRKLLVRNKSTVPLKFMEFPILIIKPTTQTSFAVQPDKKVFSIKSSEMMTITSDVKALSLIDVNYDLQRPFNPTFQFVRRN
jgi:hypothetical protein